jgi:hypothetical protein
MAKSNGITPVENNEVLMTPVQASEYTGRAKAKIAKALDDPRFATIFTNDTIKRTEFPGYPAIVQIRQSALDQWVAATPSTANGTKGEGSRAARSAEGRRYVTRIPDPVKHLVTAAFDQINAEHGTSIKLESGYKPRKAKGAADSSASNSDADQPVSTDRVPTFEHELVEA